MAEKCIVKGCKKDAGYKDYCPMHYQRIKRYGTTELPEKEEKMCVVDGCKGKAISKCMCKKHYRETVKAEKLKKLREIKKIAILSDKCCVNGCNEKEHRRGYCSKHYQRVKKHGSAITDSGVYKEMSLRERLLLKSCVTDSGCWEWSGYLNKKGYGVLSVDNNPKSAHTASYESFVGTIPEGLCVCHACDNRSCINPSHLFLGTVEDNNKDRDDKNRAAKGESSGQSVLTEKQVIKIKKLLAKGEHTNAEIGEKFGVSGWAISRIKCGKNWKHVEI